MKNCVKCQNLEAIIGDLKSDCENYLAVKRGDILDEQINECLETEVALQRRIKELEDALAVTAAHITAAEIEIDHAEIENLTLQARLKELEGALERISKSGGITTEFSQYDVGDVNGPAMSHAREIAKAALGEK